MSSRTEACRGYEQLASLSSSTALASVPTPGYSASELRALVQCDKLAGQSVRWRGDATAPTALVGMLLEPGQYFETSATLADLRFIEVTAGAKINVTYTEYS